MSEEAGLKLVEGVKYFHISQAVGLKTVKRVIRAVDGVSFSTMPSETVGLVGESGCGKSTVGKILMRLLNPDNGSVWLDDLCLTSLSGEALRKARAKMSMVFQDSTAALNPRQRVADIVVETLVAQRRIKTVADRRAEAVRLMQTVGLPADMIYRYPHELSGGQRQRVCIARAVSGEPSYIVLDEPTSALDVSVRGQIISLLRDLQNERGIGYLLISHDISLVKHICKSVMVMYAGRVVESGDVVDVLSNPRHPYTQILLKSVLTTQSTGIQLAQSVKGELGNALEEMAGCRFRFRCPYAREICSSTTPELAVHSGGNQNVACHFSDSLS